MKISKKLVKKVIDYIFITCTIILLILLCLYVANIDTSKVVEGEAKATIVNVYKTHKGYFAELQLTDESKTEIGYNDIITLQCDFIFYSKQKEGKVKKLIYRKTSQSIFGRELDVTYYFDFKRKEK